MKRIVIILACFFTIASCNFMAPTPATEKQIKEAMGNAKFEQDIIQRLDSYQLLESFLEENIDTIIQFRYKKNITTLMGGKGEKDSSYLVDDECYNFFQGNQNYDISNVPDLLKKELDSVFNSFGQSNIKSFEICKNKKIRVEIRSDYKEHGLYVSHELIWNSKIEDDYYFSVNKDTLLRSNCIYRIGLTEHHGH